MASSSPAPPRHPTQERERRPPTRSHRRESDPACLCSLQRPDGARDRAGHRLLPQFVHALQISLTQAVEQQLADDRVVADLCGAQAGEALRRQSDAQASADPQPTRSIVCGVLVCRGWCA